MGRLVADPELKQTQSGIAMCRVSIAVDRGFAKQGEEKKTDFFEITFWRQQAEFVSRYFTKGRVIHVEGRLQNDNYTDQNGQKHYRNTIQADNVAFCGDKSQSQSQQQGGGYAPYTQQRQSSGYYQPPMQQQPSGYYQQQPMQPQYQQTAQTPQYGQRRAAAGDSLPYAPTVQAATCTPQYGQPQQSYNAPPPAQNQPPPIGDLSDYEEILADGEVPF